jgi:hypothetical protein
LFIGSQLGSCREDIFKEIDILCGLNHQNVVYLKEYFEEGNKVRCASSINGTSHAMLVSALWTNIWYRQSSIPR